MIPIIEIEEYLTEKGASPFADWFDALEPQAAAIITVGLARLAEGNTSTVEPIGEGASELKINRGPGDRVYFGRDGKALVILLGRRHEAPSEQRHRRCFGALAKLQSA
ncbi:MAG: type II toxin-antitoxin system RelE/ParE family toxin [Methylocystis silviterrae]|uniref:type II toxin-antitoxin system RelE/ParE family toxin n=1 Tax=Methylocystis silviterrae TaxID=2743612 RepID=UPI003BC9FD0E